MSIRTRIGWILRRYADRVDHDNAPRHTGYSFTFEQREGIRFRYDGRGCPVAYLSQTDYARAHAEADTAMPDLPPFLPDPRLTRTEGRP